MTQEKHAELLARAFLTTYAAAVGGAVSSPQAMGTAKVQELAERFARRSAEELDKFIREVAWVDGP